MEIHHPDAPIHSIKEFLVHLSLVTIGILIALALEGAVAALHHRHLVAEAEENMQTEIADNRSQLEAALARAPLAEDELKAAIRTITMERTRTNKTDSDHPFAFGFAVVRLRSTAWETAKAIGAVSYMSYSEAKRFTDVYLLQEELLKLQDQTLQKWIGLQRLSYSLEPAVLAHFSDQQLSELTQQVMETYSYTNTEISFAKRLDQEYAKFH